MKKLASAICFALTLTVATPVWAFVLSSTPTLPVLGVSYSSSMGVGCFPAAGVCVAPGNITQTSVVSSQFNANGQNIITNVSYTGILTTLSNVPIGPISLSGTLEQQVLGRTFSTELGAWEVELHGLSMSGPVLGQTLTLMLDETNASTGFASIASVVGNPDLFRIDSFFDVFVELMLDTNPPLITTRGPVRLSLPAVPVPEPGTLALLGLGLAWVGVMRRRRANCPIA